MGWCLKFNDMPYRAGSRNANLNKSTFPVSDCLADDPRETRERPAKKQGEVAEGKILIIGLFWGREKVCKGRRQSEPVNQ